MKRTRVWISSCLLFTCSCFVASGLLAQQKIELVDGDRVAFLGGTLFERDRLYGEIETSLTMHFRGKRVSFRNIGWDGDTVFGDARAGGRRGAVFGDAAEGFTRMLQHVQKVNPTILFIAYGASEAHAGKGGVEAFAQGLERLLNALKAPRRRIVLLTPLRILGEGVPQRLMAATQVDQLNLNLKRYRDVIVREGHSRGVPVVDLFNSPDLVDARDRVNGLHLSESGYRVLGQYLVQNECVKSSAKKALSQGARKELADTIRRKNELFYNYWRPRNDAFVFGERKSEQVPVQLELPQFEALVQEWEESIQSLAR